MKDYTQTNIKNIESIDLSEWSIGISIGRDSECMSSQVLKCILNESNIYHFMQHDCDDLTFNATVNIDESIFDNNPFTTVNISKEIDEEIDTFVHDSKVEGVDNWLEEILSLRGKVFKILNNIDSAILGVYMGDK